MSTDTYSIITHARKVPIVNGGDIVIEVGEGNTFKHLERECCLKDATVGRQRHGVGSKYHLRRAEIHCDGEVVGSVARFDTDDEWLATIGTDDDREHKDPVCAAYLLLSLIESERIAAAA